MRRRTLTTALAMLACGVTAACGSSTSPDPAARSTAPLASPPATTPTSGTAAATTAQAATPATFEFYASPWGVRNTITIATPSARKYTGGTLSVEGAVKPTKASFWSQRMEAKGDAPVSPFPAQTGDDVLAEASVFPSCDGPVGTPLFTLTWTTDQGAQSETFTPKDASGYREARSEYCAMAPAILVNGHTRKPSGAFRVTAQISNPGTSELALDFKGLDQQGVHWKPVHATIGASGLTTVVFTGTGNLENAGCADAPWDQDLVLLGGKPLKPGEDGTSAC